MDGSESRSTGAGEIDKVEQTYQVPGPAQPGPAAGPVQGVFAAQEIKPQARVLAIDRGIRCVVTLNYDRMRGMEPEDTLF